MKKKKENTVLRVAKLFLMIQMFMYDLWSVLFISFCHKFFHFCKVINKCIVFIMAKKIPFFFFSLFFFL